MSPEKESGPAAPDDDDLLFSLLDDVLSGSDLGQVSTPYPAEADQMINTAEIASEHEEQGGGTGGRLRHPSPMPTPLAPRPLLTRTSSRPWDRSSNDTPPDDIRMKEGINARTEPAKKRRLKPRQQAASPVLQESVGKDDDEDRSQVEVNKSMESTNITKSFFTGADEDITSPSSPTREQQLQYDSSGGNVGVSHGAPGASSGTISRPPGADQGSRGSRTDPNGVPGSAAPTPRLSDPLMVAARAAITAESLGAASRYDEDDPDRNRRDEGEGGLSAAGHARRPLDGRSSGAASPWRRSAGRVVGLLEPDALVVQRRVGADLLPSSPPPPRDLSPPPLSEAQSQRRSAPASESSSSGRGNAILRPQRHPSSNQSREDGRRGAFPDRSASISKRGPQAGVARQSAPAGVPPVGVDAPSTRVPRRLRAAAAAASAGPSLRQQLAEELARSEEVSRRQRQPSQQQRGASGMITSEPGPGRSSSAIEDLDLDPHPAGSDDTALDRPTLASSREAGSRDHSEINADNWRHSVADLFPSVRGGPIKPICMEVNFIHISAHRSPLFIHWLSPILSTRRERPSRVSHWSQYLNTRFTLTIHTFLLQVYDPVWHSSLFEFLSDLWPAVGKAHAGQGSRLRGGGMLSARTRVEQQELMRRAYEFAGLCWRAQDTRLVCACVWGSP